MRRLLAAAPPSELAAAAGLYWNIATVAFSVVHTPQARGMPTKAQNTAACQSSPPLPMPKDPDGMSVALLALAA